MKYYFILQYRRSIREIRRLGIHPGVGIGMLLLLFGGFSIILFQKTSMAPYVYGPTGFSFVFAAGERRKNQFLENIFPREQFLRIRLLENTLCALPFIIFLLIKQAWTVAAVLAALAFLLAFYNNVGRTRFQIPSPFSKYPYEFTVGFRRAWFLFLASALLTAISVRYHNFNLGVASLLGFFFICLSFYSDNEPLFFVWIYARCPRDFLFGKIKTALRYGALFSLPWLTTLVIFNPERILILFVVEIIGLLYIMLAVVAAYTSFPGQKSIIRLLQFCVALLFPPLLLLVIPLFFQQSVARLKSFLPC